MAEEKDEQQPRAADTKAAADPAPAADPSAPRPQAAPATAAPDHAKAQHPAGTIPATAPPVSTPPVTATGDAAPAPRSNAASGAPAPAPAAPPKPATAAAAKPAAPAAAPKPAAAAPAKGQPEDVSRRGFLKWTLPIGWVAFSAACTSGLVATARFLFPNVLFEPPQTFKAGFPGEYNVGEVDTRWKDAFGVWVVREADGFYALIAICTHLGCSPNWLPAENKFKCPCHGSGFYRSGMHFEGPAPRPLERARIVLADDGQLLIDKSVKFQEEKGEWTKAGAFLKA